MDKNKGLAGAVPRKIAFATYLRQDQKDFITEQAQEDGRSLASYVERLIDMEMKRKING